MAYPAAPPPPAPPPPPVAAEGYDAGAGDMVVTSSRVASPRSAPEASAPAMETAGRADRRMMPPYPYPTPPRPPRPQAGLLTAGEHDDLLNPELYAAYVRSSDLGQQIPVLPRVDTQRMLTVRVNDTNGSPVAFAPVVLRCSDGNSLRMATQADGTVTFFPALDRLSPSVTVSSQGQSRRVNIGPGPGVQQVGLTVGASSVAATKLDLMLVVDTTGSMGDEIAYLQSELQSIIATLRQRHPALDIRIGFVFYRDEGDDYVTATVPFTRSVAEARGTLSQYSANGGGDYPEAMDQALVLAVGQQWRADAVKTMLLVADAPPHDERFDLAWSAVEAARQRRIHVVPVAASGVGDKAEYFMRATSALTQSRYLFLTDDSGIGNPHAPPAVDCYLVTRLDGLIRRVIDSQLSGRRIEPDADEVIRTVGEYDNGRCILPAHFQTSQSGEQ